MIRYQDTNTGAIVNVSDDKVLGAEWQPYDGSVAPEPEPEGYEAMTVAELKTEIEGRNRGRNAGDEIPMDGKKADLIAGLEADDDDA